MKKLSELKKSSNLDIQEDNIGYIGAGDLKKYLQIANKFLSDDAIKVIQYTIDHNDDFGKDNTLESFYANGLPKEEPQRSVYKGIAKLKRQNRLLEIPQFQTEEQFEGILNKEISPDEILLDLASESGRNACVKKYTPLVHKIARSYMNKSNLTYDDLLGAGFEGLATAMNDYGKRTEKALADEEQYKTKTFLAFAYSRIQFSIIASIQNESRVVRVPKSNQIKQKEERGGIQKSNQVSGDQIVSTSKDGATRNLFSTIAASTTSDRSIDQDDQDFLWDKVKKRIRELCDDNAWQVLCWRFGLDGHKKLKNKEIANKLGIGESLVTYYYNKIIQIFFKDPIIKKYGSELYELLHESANKKEDEDTVFEHPMKLGEVQEDN